MELSVYLPVSYLVVIISVATQEIHCSTYLAGHIVGYDAPESHRANEVLPPPEGPFLCTNHLGEIVLDFWIF